MMVVLGVTVLFLTWWCTEFAGTMVLPLGGKEYEQMREAILKAEHQYALGGKVFLSPEEQQADQVLVELKKRELQSASGVRIPSAMHFFEAKPLIEASGMFKVLKTMPKGAVLHLHNSAAVSSSWIIQNLTYRGEAKLCTQNGRHYFTVRSQSYCPANQTRVINEMRKEWTDGPGSFDRWLETLINLKLKPRKPSATVDDIWKDFESCFDAMKGFLQYKPFFEAYHRRLLHEFHRDNVCYLELRVSFPRLIDADGKEYGPVEVGYILYRLVIEFRRQNPTFHGVKLILAKHRNMTDDDLANALKLYESLTTTLRGFVVGFDLVGQEDPQRSLKSFAPTLLRSSSLETPPRYFFHAGESVSYYTEADQNLVDAILLDTRRIGHGYSLFKHPILWHAVRRKQIVLEVCPISNQVLGLVQDLRNHPGSFYATQNIPMVIASDDPGFWDAVGVSYDYYYAFMAMAPSAGLGFLKQLVWDSIKYSAISEEERQNITTALQHQWHEFVQGLINGSAT
ncbi:adenosine deaminase 2-like [Anopheles albimanus]|nr:adenosine deaminase 2-like [Anopheles albimanus]